jgi:hypothetical protein
MSWYESEVSSNRWGIYRVMGMKFDFFRKKIDFFEALTIKNG